MREASVDDPMFDGARIDTFIAEKMRLCSRSQIRQWVSKIIVNGKEVKPGKRLKLGDRVVVFYNEPKPPDILPENISLDIIYEDENILVINKPQGMVVHPAPGNYTGTVVNALMYRYTSFRGHPDSVRKMIPDTGDINMPDDKIGYHVRPGIVHRLDKDTSGVLVIAKNLETLEFLAGEFKSRRVKKVYLAVVKGMLPNRKGRISVNLVRDSRNRKRFTWSNSPDKGKKAITDYKVLKSFNGYSFVLLRPRTGRTHQLRVHMKYIGCPILGDPVYSRKDKLFPDATLMLHAYKIWIGVPLSLDYLSKDRYSFSVDSNALRRFKAPLPPRFKMLLKSLASL